MEGLPPTETVFDRLECQAKKIEALERLLDDKDKTIEDLVKEGDALKIKLVKNRELLEKTMYRLGVLTGKLEKATGKPYPGCLDV
jgi:hypothetical protein